MRIEFLVKGGGLFHEAFGATESIAMDIARKEIGDQVDTLERRLTFYGEESPRVGAEQVLKAFKEHSDADFPWIDKPFQNMNEFIGQATSGPTRAIRHDQDKPDMSLLSPIAMFGTARVMTHGLKKYPGSQWKKGMAWSKVTAALLRHLFKFMAGEDFDEETGEAHVDHVAANAMFLQEYFRKHKDLDDRMKTGLE